VSAIQDIVSLLGPAGVPAVTAATAYAPFDFFERIASSQAKHALTEQIQRLNVANAATLPKGTVDLFRFVFGSTHLSIRCILASAWVSVAGILILGGIKSLLDPAFYQFFVETFRSADHLIDWLLLYWIPFSIVPDYVNLFKTRLVLSVLARKNLPLVVLPIVLIADVAIGLLVFVLGLVIFAFLFFVAALIIDDYITPIIFIELMPSFDLHDFLVDFPSLIGGLLVILWELLGTIIRFETSWSVLFYAGMLPSIWLWLYIAPIFVARVVSRSGWLLNWSRWFLDIDQSPFRSVGTIAAVLAFAFTLIGIAVMQFV
jgi:hypothetical protein